MKDLRLNLTVLFNTVFIILTTEADLMEINSY